MLNFSQISLFPSSKTGEMRCFSCKFELAGLGEVTMSEFSISKEAIKMIEKELTIQIMQRLGRDFGGVFNEEKTIHREGHQTQEVLSVPEKSNSSMADMFGQKSIPSNMS